MTEKNETATTPVSPSGFKALKITFFILCLIPAVLLLFAVQVLFIPIILGFLSAYLLDPIVSRLEAKGLPRPSAIVVVFIGIGFTFIGILIYLVPILLSEIHQFAERRETYQLFLLNRYEELRAWVMSNVPVEVPWKSLEKDFFAKSSSLSVDWVRAVPAKVAGSVEVILSFVIVCPLLAFFLLKDGLPLKKQVIEWVPNRYFELSLELFHHISAQVGNFIRGQLADSIINAIMISLLLYMIGLPYALVIGVFSGAANAVPFVGPLLGGSLAVIVAFVSGGPSVLLVAATFGFAHLIDVMFIYPKTVGQSLKLHEMVVIVGVIVGGHLGGVLGMLLIIPLLGILFQSIKITYRLMRGYHII